MLSAFSNLAKIRNPPGSGMDGDCCHAHNPQQQSPTECIREGWRRASPRTELLHGTRIAARRTYHGYGRGDSAPQ